MHSNTSRLGMNIEEAWASGITGNGIIVVHLDSGLDYLHPDLYDAYEDSVSYDFEEGDKYPYPDINRFVSFSLIKANIKWNPISALMVPTWLGLWQLRKITMFAQSV